MPTYWTRNWLVRSIFMLSTLLFRSNSLGRLVLVRAASTTTAPLSRQMSTITERRYAPFRKHPQLFDDEFDVKYLHEDFVLILDAFEKANAKDDDPDTIIPDLLRKEMDGVYSFNVFTDMFVQLWNEEISNFYQTAETEKIPIKRPNSMNSYGVVVNDMGLRPLISSFQQEYLWPLARRLFPIHASQFDDHHAFMVRYRANEDLGLDMHTDDSDVRNTFLSQLCVSCFLSFQRLSNYLFVTCHRSLLMCVWANRALPARHCPFVACLVRPTTGNTRIPIITKLAAPSCTWAHGGMAPMTLRAVGGPI